MIRLTFLNPPPELLETHWQFSDSSVICIGRAPDNDVVIPVASVSRYHLELRRTHRSATEETWVFSNLGKNGTFINGVLRSQGSLPNEASIQLAVNGPLLQCQIDLQVPAAPASNQQIPLPPAPPVATPQCQHQGNPPGQLFCVHCGQPLKVERRIRQYQILKTLGQGGMGTTYLAWQPPAASPQVLPSSPTLLVLKEINPDLANLAKAQELFEREARVLQTLNHPGIPKFFDFFAEGKQQYLAMELIHGDDLEHWVIQHGPVSLSLAIAWMKQVCAVLQYLHQQTPPLIHRDIRPANLMVRRRDGQILVLDFGAVKELGTPFKTRIGTEGYSAPEQQRGLPVIQSDLYAIAPTLVFLLTGQSPQQFYVRQGSEYRLHIEATPPITSTLQAVLHRLSAPNPSDRYPHAQAVAQALTACL